MFENEIPKHKIGVLHPLAVVDNSPTSSTGSAAAGDHAGHDFGRARGILQG
jgi:hypothetical protein